MVIAQQYGGRLPGRILLADARFLPALRPLAMPCGEYLLRSVDMDYCRRCSISRRDCVFDIFREADTAAYEIYHKTFISAGD